MKICIVPFLLIVSLLSLPAQGQDSSEQALPTGPLLKRASSPASWTITTQTLDSSPGTTSTGASTAGANPDAKKKAKPTVMVVVKDLNLILEKTVTESGEMIETWRTENWAVTRSTGWSWMVSPCTGNGNTFNNADYSKSDFAGFAWISLSNFSGRKMVMGRKCLIFKDRIITMDPAALEMAKGAIDVKLHGPVSDDQFKVNVEAEIDDETRLPVILIYQTPIGNATRTYSFQAPDGSLSLPPDVKQLIDKYDRYVKRLIAPHAPI